MRWDHRYLVEILTSQKFFHETQGWSKNITPKTNQESQQKTKKNLQVMCCCFACLKKPLNKKICGKKKAKKKQLCFLNGLSVRLLLGETEKRSEIWALIGAWVPNTSSDLDGQMWESCGCVVWSKIGLRGGGWWWFSKSSLMFPEVPQSSMDLVGVSHQLGCDSPKSSLKFGKVPLIFPRNWRLMCVRVDDSCHFCWPSKSLRGKKRFSNWIWLGVSQQLECDSPNLP